MFENEKVANDVEAYILGFLYADGTVVANGAKTKTYKTLNIKVKRTDDEVLFKMNKYLNGNIKYYNEELNGKLFEKARLSVYDKNLCNRLIKLGITPNKTYEENSFVFDNIPDEYKWSFIRGYFDGDGCINSNKNNQFTFELCSRNKKILESILNFIKMYINTSSKITKGDGVFRIRIGGNRLVIEIRNYLYDNASIYLNRKYEKFMEIKSPEYKRKYIGIYYIEKYDKYKCTISFNSKKKFLGYFKTELEAVKAYNKEARKLGKKEQIIDE